MSINSLRVKVWDFPHQSDRFPRMRRSAGNKNKRHPYSLTITLRIPPLTEYYPRLWMSDKTDDVLKHYLDCMQIGGVWKSASCEATIIMGGEQVPLFEESLTFGQCGFKDGDTLHLLFHCSPNFVKIPIHSLVQRETYPTYTSALVPVSYLKRLHFQLTTSYNSDVYGVSSDVMVLKNGDGELMEGSKTLAEYNIQENTILQSDMPSYNISYVVPAFTKLERVLFEPYATLRTFRLMNRTRSDRWGWGPFRAVVCDAEGIISYVYMDINQMKFYTIKANNTGVYHYYVLENHHTIKDLHEMVNGNRENQYEGRACFVKSRIAAASPVADFAFDGAWIKAFAPQIEAEPNSMNEKKAMRLFYFPELSEVVHLGHYNSLDTVLKVEADICGREGLDRENKILLHGKIEKENGNSVMSSWATLLQYHTRFESNPLVILRRSKNYQSDPKHPTITVHVKWLTRTHEPVKLVLSASARISWLRDQIEDIIQVPRFMQKLTFFGKSLEDKHTLKEVGITNGATVVMMPWDVKKEEEQEEGRSSPQSPRHR